jgi:hypothetical protein
MELLATVTSEREFSQAVETIRDNFLNDAADVIMAYVAKLEKEIDDLETTIDLMGARPKRKQKWDDE